jgi:DNA polymerase-4/DNA polymerase V
MFGIVRRYTPLVEEYSIDECFAELTGLRRSLRMPYEEMAERIKHDLDSELGMTFSVGLAPTKVLAKVGSKWKKPSGLTIIHRNAIPRFLAELTTGKIWGIGEQTSAHLLALGVKTALQFAEKPEWWIKEKLAKPQYEIWKELRGESVYPLATEEKRDYQTISKTKTFTPPSADREFVFSELSKNIENACIKARRHGLVSREVFFFLKTQDFKYRGLEIKLSRATNIPREILEVTRANLDRVFIRGERYRSTGIVLGKLISGECSQPDLFGGTVKADAMKMVYREIDKVDAKYGKHTVFLGSSFLAIQNPAHEDETGRGDTVARMKNLLRGETARRHLGIPMLGEVN